MEALDGLALTKDSEEALQCFHKMAEHPDKKNPLVIFAQYQLGILSKNVQNNQAAKYWLRLATGFENGVNGPHEQNLLKIVLNETNIENELITLVRQSAQQLLEDIAKLEEQEKAKQALEQKNKEIEKKNQALERQNKQIQAETQKLERILRDSSHMLANEIHPHNIMNVAETLKEQGLKKEAMLLYKAYRGEIFISHQNELLLAQYRDSDQFRQKVLGNRAEANSDSATDTSVYAILNEALEKATSNFLDKSKYKALQKVRRRIFGDNTNLLEERHQQFVNKIYLEEQKALEWVNNNLMPIRSDFSEKWAQLRLEKNKYTEALLHKHFYELFINAYKYSDFNGLEIRFFENNLEEKAYLFSQWTNSYEDNNSISTGNGLEGLKAELESLNEGAISLFRQDDNKTFSITIAIQEQLLYLPPVLFEVKLPT
ncbi:MAG: hypothetical protein B6247_29625 [Candidatus Parabeggiatoa sp. nov. 2]|nr:MAG: hypothetical protein B6247_29625 [Beggiatoa sp. 4572_84]